MSDLAGRIAAQQTKKPATQKKAKKAAKPKPKKQAATGGRKKLTVDLDADRYRQLSIAALDLDCSRVEVLRVLLDALDDDAGLLELVRERIGSGDAHRPRGFAARPELAADARRSRQHVN